MKDEKTRGELTLIIYYTQIQSLNYLIAQMTKALRTLPDDGRLENALTELYDVRGGFIHFNKDFNPLPKELELPKRDCDAIKEIVMRRRMIRNG